MNTEHTNQSRTQFEAWASEHCCAVGGISFKRFSDDGASSIYNDPNVETAWQAWQAASQQQAEPVAWGCFHFGGKHDGKLYSFSNTKEQADAYIANIHQSRDDITLRCGPIYTNQPTDAAQPPAQPQAECGSCDGFDSGCEECSGLGKDGHLAALRQLANVAHRVAHAMGLPAGFDVTTLPDVVAQRLAAQQQAEPVQTGRCAACNIETGTVRPCDICGVQTVAAQLTAVAVAVPDAEILAHFHGGKDQDAMNYSNLRDVVYQFTQSELLCAARAMLAAAPQAADPIKRLIAMHNELLGEYPYCYFELAYTRRTDWMAWLCTKPREDDPERKVLACGQGLTAEEACAEAISAAQKGGAA